MNVSAIRSAVLAATAAALVSAAVACSSSAPAAPTDAAPSPPGHAEFEQCMTDNGVPAPPQGHRPPPPPQGAVGPPPPPGVDQDTWDQALQACRSLAPAPPQP